MRIMVIVPMPTRSNLGLKTQDSIKFAFDVVHDWRVPKKVKPMIILRGLKSCKQCCNSGRQRWIGRSVCNVYLHDAQYAFTPVRK